MWFVVPDRPWLAWAYREGGSKREWTADLTPFAEPLACAGPLQTGWLFFFPRGCFAEHNYMQHLTTELVIYVLLKWRRKGIGMNINVLWEDGAFFSSLLGTGAGYRREDANWSLGELTGTHFPLEWCIRGMPYPSTTVWWFRERREGRVQLPYLQTFDEISDLLLKILTTPFLRSVLLLVRGNTVWLRCSEGHVR